MAGQTNQIDAQLAGLNKPVLPFVTNLAYTALNQPKTWAWNHGPAGTPPLAASRSFDTDGRMASNEFASYGFDAASRITSITQNLWATLDTTDPVTGAVTNSTFTTPLSWNAAYDNRNRLTSFGRNNASSSTSYTYDANSNRLSAILQTTSDTDQDGDFDAVDFSKTTSQTLAVGAGSNQLLGFNQTLTTQRTNSQGNPVTSTANSQITYSLDANGNLTSDGLRLFEYDGQNRLAKVLVSQSADASKVAGYGCLASNANRSRSVKSDSGMAVTMEAQPASNRFAQPGPRLTTACQVSISWSASLRSR